jgi:preprotein translocase subunit YajC
MNVRNKLILIGLATTAVAFQPAAAQTAPAAAGFTAGAKVSDTAGAEVGTITNVDGDYVILKTDKHEVRLPKASFTAHEGGFIMAMTRDQVNAAVEQSLASAAEKIVVGASITGSQGGAVGTIDALDDQFVTVKLASGKLVRLPRSGIAPGPNGPVIGMTVAELEAAAGAGTGAEAGAQ